MTERKSVLLINDEWGTAKGGVSTVHRQLASLAAEADLDVHCLALSATDEDKANAREKKINLILPYVKDNLDDRDPKLNWLVCHETFYPDVRSTIPNVQVIIGHIPITDVAAFEWKERVFPNAKLYLFNHVISENIEVYKDSWTPERVQMREQRALEAAKRADVIFSVGPKMFDHFKNKYRAIPGVENKHHQFIPLPDSSFFDLEISDPTLTRTKQVVTFGRITGVEKLKGYDLVARAMSDVTKTFCDMGQPAPQWIVRGVPPDDGKKTMAFLKQHIRCNQLRPKLFPYGSQDEIRQDLLQSHLCIMASRSEPFGLVAFEAIAAGIPVLVTKNSGLAEFLEEEFPEIAQLIVVNVGINETFDDEDVKVWADKIRDTLSSSRYRAAVNRANDLKRKISDCPAVTESNKKFKQLCKEP